MVKAIVFLKKKDGISREEFIDYYENHHRHLVRRLLTPIGEYRRTYPVYDELHGADGETPTDDHPGFDVITEIWFESEAAWDEFLEIISRPEVAAEIAEDELNFLDRSANRLLRVDEYISVGD
jgi:hypothetical protein